LISGLLDREWESRVEEIARTGRIKPKDVLTIAVLTLNRGVGEVAREVGGLRTVVGMLTREVEELRKEVEKAKMEVAMLAGEAREFRKDAATQEDLTREANELRVLHTRLCTELKSNLNNLKRITCIGLSTLTVIALLHVFIPFIHT